MSSTVREVIPLMMEACRFFHWGIFGRSLDLCPVQRGVLSRFTINYYAKMNNPERISGELIQVLNQCEQSPEDTAVRRMVELKTEFDQALEKVLQELSELNVDTVNGFIPNPLAEERTRINEYFVVLQSELSEKMTLLARFQQDLHDRCSHILKINKYGIYQDKPQDIDLEVEEFRYIPDSRFLPEHWSRCQITTKTDTISVQQLKELEDYLHSGGNFSTHWEPVGWIKRLMDWETSLAFHKLVESRAPSDSIVPLNTLLMWLKDLLLGRKSIHACHKIFLRSF